DWPFPICKGSHSTKESKTRTLEGTGLCDSEPKQTRGCVEAIFQNDQDQNKPVAGCTEPTTKHPRKCTP
ncbi:7491_t:CDS:2, partial [Gigaspora rosea]